MKELIRRQWDRVGAGACIVVGIVLLIAGWLGVSGNAYPAAQLPYIISAGIGGLFALGIGATLWISADLRDEWQKLNRIEQAIDRLADETAGTNGHRPIVTSSRAPLTADDPLAPPVNGRRRKTAARAGA